MGFLYFLIWSQHNVYLDDLPEILKKLLLQDTTAVQLNRSMDEFTKLIEKLLNQQSYQPSGSEIFNAGNSILS